MHHVMYLFTHRNVSPGNLITSYHLVSSWSMVMAMIQQHGSVPTLWTRRKRKKETLSSLSLWIIVISIYSLRESLIITGMWKIWSLSGKTLLCLQSGIKIYWLISLNHLFWLLTILWFLYNQLIFWKCFWWCVLEKTQWHIWLCGPEELHLYI